MTKVYCNFLRPRYIIDRVNTLNSNVIFYECIDQLNSTDTNFVDSVADSFSFNTYSLTVPNRHDLDKYIDDNYDYLLNMAKQEDEKKESAEIRQKRDVLLQESDVHVLLDRLGLKIPSGDTFAAWKPFLSELASAVSGEWATYRQALRDVPQQEGFPYNVTWPIKPEE